LVKEQVASNREHEMNKKTIAWIAIALLLSIVVIFIGLRRFYIPDYPEGVLYDKVTYVIDPQTILTSLDRGETDVFLPAPPEPEGSWPIIWPPGSFVWNEQSFKKVADALHQLVWQEPLQNWQLIRASYQINQCQEIFGGIDSASLSFFQNEGGQNVVHGFWINPMYGNVTAGNQYSQRMGWSHWETIDPDKMKISNVDAALLVAEENGGKEIRSSLKNKCKITLLLAPDRYKYNFLTHPLNRYGWGWNVIYWSNQSNSDPLFSIVIDPYTGGFKIQK
jgi:hypothetical protein